MQAQEAIIDLDAVPTADPQVIDLDAVAAPAAEEPIIDLDAPKGSVFNRASELLSSGLQAVVAPVLSGIESASDYVTGTTKAEKDAEKDTAYIMDTQVKVQPGVPNSPTRKIPSWDQRIAAVERIKDLEEQKVKLTPKLREELGRLKASEEGYSKVAALPRAPKSRNNTGGLAANITDEEVAAIANQYGAEVPWLLSQLATEGISLESTPEQVSAGEGGQSVLGQVAGMVDSWGAGIGKYINRTTASVPNRRALEALRRVAGSRFGWARTAAEVAGGIPLGMGTGKMLSMGAGKIAASTTPVQGLLGMSAPRAAQLAEAAAVGTDILGTGAVIGLTQSEQGESKLKNALHGASIGAPFLGLGPAVKGVGAVAGLSKQAMNAVTGTKTRLVQAAIPQAFETAATKASQEVSGRLTQLITDAQAGLPNADAKALAAKLGMSIEASTTDADIAKYLLDAQSGMFTKAPGQTEQVFKRMLVDQNFDVELNKRLRNSIFKQSRIGRLADTFSAAPWVASIYDARHGTDGMQVIDRMGADLRYSAAVADTWGSRFRDEVIEPIRKVKNSDAQLSTMTDEEVLAHMYDAIDKGQVPTTLQGPAANTAKFFEDFRQELNKVKADSGMPMINVQKYSKGAYVPHAVKQGMDKVVALEQRLGERLTAIVMTGDPTKVLADVPDLRMQFDSKDVTKVLGLLEGKTPQESKLWGTADVVKAFRKHSTVSGKGVEGTITDSPTMLAALEKRTGEVPDWFREKNLAKVTGNYISDALHQVYVEPHLRDAELLRGIMQQSNDADGFTFWDSWLRQNRFGDSSGLGVFGSAGAATKAATNMWKHFAKLKAAKNEADGRIGKADVWNAVAEIPDEVVAMTRHNMYSYFLGAGNVKATVENAIQPLTMGIPMLGTTYGSSVATRALARPLPQAAKLPGGRFITYEQSRELQQLLKGQLHKQGIVGKSAEQASKFGLLLFNATEQFSRRWATKMGGVVAEDVLAGKAAAMNFVEGMPGSYSRSVKQALAAKRPQDVERLMTDYMVNRISLDYSRAAQSEWSRSLGPMLSSFSRWPAEAVGMMNQAVRGAEFGQSKIGHAAKSNASGHFQMLGALLLSEKLYEGIQDYDDAVKESRIYNVVTGARGLPAFNAMSSIGGMGVGKYQSPIIEAMGQAAIGAAGMAKEGFADEDTAKAQLRLMRAADNVTGMFVPGMWVFKMADTYDRFTNDSMDEKPMGPAQRVNSWVE